MKFPNAYLIAAAATFTAGAAVADYPEKPIKIMVGFSAGGSTDTARGFASYIRSGEHEWSASVRSEPAGASGQKAKLFWVKSQMDIHYMINIGTFSVGELAKDETDLTVLWMTLQIWDAHRSS